MERWGTGARRITACAGFTAPGGKPGPPPPAPAVGKLFAPCGTTGIVILITFSTFSLLAGGAAVALAGAPASERGRFFVFLSWPERRKVPYYMCSLIQPPIQTFI